MKKNTRSNAIYLSVLIDIKTRGLDRVFTYDATPSNGPVPADELIGYSCVVPLNNRYVVGYVVDQDVVVDEGWASDIKSVDRYIDGPFFNPLAAPLARWISEEYGSSLAESLRLFVPPAGKVSLELLEGGAYRIVDNGPKPLYTSYYSLTAEGLNADIPTRAHKQRALVEALKGGERPTDELKIELGSSISKQLEDFVTRGWALRRDVRVFRGDRSYDPRHYKRPEFLNNEQEHACQTITRAMHADKAQTFVLDGVTGSGKTEVYLRVIEDAIDRGKTAIVLVPEISLTPQTVGRFQARFEGRVALLHSRLSAVERQDQWERIQRGGADVVVGARSALFAPLSNVGLIVIDEEHDASYKQSSSPRYHARDVAQKMAELLSVPLVLGSATPSFEALFRVHEGEWKLLSLPHRANNVMLPEAQIVDLTQEFKDSNRSMFSRALQTSLRRVITEKQKALLLLNRRGSASFLLCRECGYVPQCPDCSVSLTLHEHDGHLHCHQCNRIFPLMGTCPECGSPYLQQFNAGTQRLEAALRALYPTLPLVRMDADTTKGRDGHQRVLDEFAQLDYGVLIGTQMIAKGLDFPEVTLVGVVTADTILNLPDFQASERTYQLLEQVSGRAGRGTLPGEVIIQTYWPDHRAVIAAAQHNRDYFYTQEAQVRKELGYPPFRRLANVIITSDNRNDASATAQAFAQRALDELNDIELLGPAPCVIERIKKKFRFHVLIKAQRGTPLGGLLNDIARTLKRPQGVGIAIDIDPLSLM